MGGIVQEWRRERGLSPAALAKQVGTSRQNIENFEKNEVKQPRYLPALAKAMGYAATDDLLAGLPPPTGRPRPPRVVEPLSLVPEGLALGALALALAKRCESLPSRTRQRVAQDVAYMIANGPDEGEAHAIEALVQASGKNQATPPLGDTELPAQEEDGPRELVPDASDGPDPAGRRQHSKALRSTKEQEEWDSTPSAKRNSPQQGAEPQFIYPGGGKTGRRRGQK